MMRAVVPCTFTAKGLCVLDLETFAFVRKTLCYTTIFSILSAFSDLIIIIAYLNIFIWVDFGLPSHSFMREKVIV